MNTEAAKLIGVKKRRFQWGAFKELLELAGRHPENGARCFYDEERGLVYSERVEKDVAYTYIAKADGLNVYKVGRTKNLQARMQTLRNARPYSLLNLSAIAFSPVDYEQRIKIFFSCKASSLPKPFDKAEELLILDGKDLAKILDICSFARITGGQLPALLTRITKQYYDAVTGEAIHKEYDYKYQ